MSNVEYLLTLHKEGKIDDSALNKALNVLQPTKTVESVQPSALENLRKKRRNKKKKEKRQKQKYAHLKKAVIYELKQVLSQREKRKSTSELQLVDKPLCNYFKTYEIDAHTYIDSSALFNDKKSMLVNQINQYIKAYNDIKFSIGLSVQFSHDEDDGKRKIVVGQNHGEQSAVLDSSNVDEFYDKQTPYLHTWIEKKKILIQFQD